MATDDVLSPVAEGRRRESRYARWRAKSREQSAAFDRLTEPVRRSLRRAVMLQGTSSVVAVVVGVGIWQMFTTASVGGANGRVWLWFAVGAVATVASFVLRALAYRVSHRADLGLQARRRSR